VWNLDRIDQRSSVLDDAYTYTNDAGAGVKTSIMDTGIRTSHTEFGGRATIGFDAINDGWNGQDCGDLGHGTLVAGIAGGATYGMAPATSLVAVRELGCDNFGSISQIIAGVERVTQNAPRPAVVTMRPPATHRRSTPDHRSPAPVAVVVDAVEDRHFGRVPQRLRCSDLRVDDKATENDLLLLSIGHQRADDEPQRLVRGILADPRRVGVRHLGRLHKGVPHPPICRNGVTLRAHARGQVYGHGSGRRRRRGRLAI
jgi:hypothetical protein